MLIGKYNIQFSWILALGAFVLTCILTALGFWQLHRSDEKALLQYDIEESLAAPAIKLSSTVGDDWEKLRYRRITARGHFGLSFQIYIDNRVNQGKAGYHIISPFYLEDNSETIILINRGWVSVGNDRKIIPKVIIPDETLTIEGRLSSPRSKPTIISDKQTPDAYSNQVWTYLDISYVEKKYQLELEPYIILQENNGKDGLIRELPNYESNVTMHIGYAIQWFAFALFVVLAFIRNGVKITNLEKQNTHE